MTPRTCHDLDYLRAVDPHLLLVRLYRKSAAQNQPRTHVKDRADCPASTRQHEKRRSCRSGMRLMPSNACFRYVRSQQKWEERKGCHRVLGLLFVFVRGGWYDWYERCTLSDQAHWNRVRLYGNHLYPVIARSHETPIILYANHNLPKAYV